MRLSKALEEKELDVRLRDKLLTEGKLSKAKLEEYINTLADATASATYTEEDRKA